MYSLDEKIYKTFLTTLNGKIVEIKQENNMKFYTFVMNDEMGVGIIYNKIDEIHESFNSFSLCTKTYFYDEKNTTFIMLLKKGKKGLKDFSRVCASFVCEENRNSIILNPIDWWEEWRQLIGNTNKEQAIYPLIAELLLYYYVYKNDSTAKWNYHTYPTHDIESDSKTYEVKSTLSKYNSIIHVSSENQLKRGKNPLFLFFVRMEESLDGLCLEDVLNKFCSEKKSELMCSIKKAYPNLQTHQKKKKFKILDIRKYVVDDNFPVLNIDRNQIPSCINHISYDIDLLGLTNVYVDITGFF